MTTPTTDQQVRPLQQQILQQIEELLDQSERENKPLEIDPLRGQLFELFVTAHGAGFLEEGAECDLTADELCKSLAQRWGLDAAAQTSVANQEKLEQPHLIRMRLLWSLMRMWMEWTYAWDRWDEFHQSAKDEKFD